MCILFCLKFPKTYTKFEKTCIALYFTQSEHSLPQDSLQCLPFRIYFRQRETRISSSSFPVSASVLKSSPLHFFHSISSFSDRREHSSTFPSLSHARTHSPHVVNFNLAVKSWREREREVGVPCVAAVFCSLDINSACQCKLFGTSTDFWSCCRYKVL